MAEILNSASKNESQPESPISILVVEDDCVSLKLEARLANQLNATVTTAENGQQGLTAFLNHYRETGDYPDLMVIDLEMPLLNGYELIAAVKTYHPQQYILVVSAEQDAQCLVRLIDLGVNQFLFKPLQPQKFIESLRSAMEEWRQTQQNLLQEKTIEQQATRFNLAVDGKGDGLWDWNLATGEVYFSPGWKRMLGFNDSEISGSLKEWESRVNPEHLAQVYDDIQAHLEGATERYENEHQVRCKNGRYKWVLDRGVVVSRDEDGKPLRMIGTHSDIDEKKQFELVLQQQKSELEMIFNLNVDGIAILDRQTAFLRTNRAYQAMVGYDAAQLDALTCRELTAPEDKDKIESLMQAVITTGLVENVHKRCVVKNGRHIDVNISMALMPDGERILLSARDITEVTRQQAVIDEYLQMIDRNIITLEITEDGVVAEVSQSFLSRAQLQAQDIVGQPLQAWLMESQPELLFENGLALDENWRGQLKLRSGRYQPFWVSAKVASNVMHAEKACYTLVCHDISDQKQLEILSITDAMTGLFNRRHFESSYQSLANSARRGGSVMAFLLLDVDHFKTFNDTYGHQTGDDALIAVAKAMQWTFQRADDVCFRVGGEELAVLAKFETLDKALLHAQRVRQAIEDLQIAHCKNLPYKVLTASIGVLLMQKDGLALAIEQAYSMADQLLYQAKDEGRNRLCHRIVDASNRAE